MIIIGTIHGIYCISSAQVSLFVHVGHISEDNAFPKNKPFF